MYAGDISCRKAKALLKPSLLFLITTMIKRKFILLILLPALLFSCDIIDQNTTMSRTSDPSELFTVEKNFSQMSLERGMKKAFLHYMAKDGVILRANENPITEADAIEYLSQVDDTGFMITWKPDRAQIASSGDLGFTYGTFDIVVNNDTIKGTYVNVWKKQNGEWKFALNTVNQGLGE